MAVTERSKVDKFEGIRLPDGRIIQIIGDDVEGYKYLGVLRAYDIMHDEVQNSMKKKKYIGRVKKTLSSKLNAGNVINAVNSWAVSLLRYSGGTANWTKSELAELDRRYDGLGRVIHWEVCKKCGFKCSEKWYKHSSKSAEENEEVKLEARHCNSEKEGNGNDCCGHSCYQR